MKDKDNTKDEPVKELVAVDQQVIESEPGLNQAEGELPNNDDMWHSLVGNDPNIIIFINHSRKIQFINYTVEGLDVKEVVGKSIYEYIQPDYHHIAKETIDKVFKTGEPAYYEIKGTGPNNSISWYRTRAAAVKRHGQVIGLIQIVSDITERKQDEEKLRESEQKFRAIFDNALDGICLADVETRQMYTSNNVFCEMLGYDIEEIGKMGIAGIHPEQDLCYVLEQFDRQARGEITLARDIPMLRKDGSVFYADVNSSLLNLNEKTYLMGIFRDITERKNMEEKYRQLLEDITDGYALLQDGIYVFTNRRFCELLGYEPGQLLGVSYVNIVMPDKRQATMDLYERITQGEVVPVERFEDEVLKADGTTTTLEASIRLIPYEGKPAFSVILRDITERKQAEKDLQQSKDHFQALIENAFDTISILDAAGKIRYITPSIIRLLGYEPEECTSKKLFDFIHPEDLPDVVSAFAKTVRDGSSGTSMEVRFQHKNGSWRTIEGVGTNLLDNPSVAGYVANFHDITDRKNVEKELRRLLGDINDGYIVYQGRGIVLANQRFAEIFGYTVEQVLEQPYSRFVSPEALAEAMETYARVTDGEETIERYESKSTKQDGTEIIVDLSIKDIEYEGKPAFSVIFRDVTDQKRAKVELQHLYEQERKLRELLEEERKRRVEFTRVLVHELKTPLTPLLASSQLLAEEVGDETLVKLAENISQGAWSMSNMVNDLLDITKAEIGMLQPESKSVDLLQLLHRVADYITPMTERNKHSLILDLPLSLPLVRADENLLQQIILNLVNNASKFTPTGGRITLRARKKDASLIVEVQDTGSGISEEEQQRLFDPYHRVEGDRQRLSGLGLGLALCKTLVELHGGQIWVESHPGEGSTFGFSLPLEDS
ncbi:PAS domain S-box protein [Chloroflexota bacterium]